MGTAVISLLLAGLVVLSIRKIAKDKKNGTSCSCGGDCGSCRGCH